MGRFARSWELVKLCWGVLKQDKELVVFPVISTVVVIIVTASFIVPGIFTGFWKNVADNGPGVSLWAVVILFYLVQYVVIVFCNAALVSAVFVRLDGGNPTLGDGFRGAWSHIAAILGYAAISATVGLVLQLIRQRAGAAGAVVAGLGGMAWNIMTFLVIPILVVEDTGPIEGVKRSARLLKKTWGEQIIGTAGIGLVFGLICLAIALVGFGLGALAIGGILALGVVLMVLAVLGIVVVTLLGSTLHGIYSAAVYEYAVGGDTGVFDRETLAGAFAPRTSRRSL